jgi:glycosyltransferase involved in cell wall biosynthesis
MRVCLVYDCLFPYTVGGAERTYRSLAELLVEERHEVTYLTLRQWEGRSAPDLPGISVKAVGPRMGLYSGPGRRRILPPVIFGAGVLWYLLRHGRRFDVVHCASFPYFSLLSAALARPLASYRLVVDWHEVWTREYWREYLGALGGDIGWSIQRLCAWIPQRAFCFSRLHADRLRAEGLRGEIIVLPGEWDGLLDPLPVHDAEPIVLFAGRQIPEKQVLTLPPAIALARESVPQLRGLIFGDGPDHPALEQSLVAHGFGQFVQAPGFVPTAKVDEALDRALCMALPSRREGYGRVVLEAAARGTPSVVVAGPDNAAVELISEGENGYVAPSASPEDLAEAILKVHAAGRALRDSTSAWFARNAKRMSLRRTLEAHVGAYGPEPPPGAVRR